MASINGTNGDDIHLFGTNQVDRVSGLGGDDVISGLAGNDLLYGGTENDRLWGGSGDDALYGDSGDDLLAGELGDDLLYGGMGKDIFKFQFDTLSYASGLGDDVIVGFEKGQDRINIPNFLQPTIPFNKLDSNGNGILENSDANVSAGYGFLGAGIALDVGKALQLDQVSTIYILGTTTLTTADFLFSQF
jgi:Ca2+-binding RTX toxin-like protein